MKNKTYHPNFIKSRLLESHNNLVTLESKYNSGSIAMKSYLYKKLNSARKAYNKWQNIQNGTYFKEKKVNKVDKLSLF